MRAFCRAACELKGGEVLTKKEQALLEALEPQAQAQGVELVMLEIVGAKKSPTIRVYIDTDHGVSFDELSSAQAWINDVMDEIDPFPGAYMLEVSSPGIDRPLRTLEHFQRFSGQTAVVKTTSPLDGRSSFTGTLEGVDGNDIIMSCDGTAVRIPYAAVKRANVKGTVDFR